MRLPDHAAGRLARLAAPLLLAGALALPAAAPVAAAEPDFPADMSGYHNWTELQDEIQQVAADHPDIVSVFSIGKSYQGRPIWMAKVSDNVAEDEDEPEVLVDALHHAREHLTTEQALALLRWLTDDYGTDDTITRLVDSRETFIVFALNPDGLRYDLTGDPFRAWRKNRQRDAAGDPHVHGPQPQLRVPLGVLRRLLGQAELDRLPRSLRRSRHPRRRPLRDFVESRVIDGVQQIRTHVTLHTNGELILWPYGYTKKNVPKDMTTLDHDVFVSLGRAMAATNGYTAEQSSDLYITDGDQIDWLYGRQRIFSYTFELFPTEKRTVWGDHYPDDSKIAAQTERNRAALLLLIDRAGCPYAALGSASAAANCGPLFDDLEINRDWVRDPFGTDTATRGTWAVANPQPTRTSAGKMQRGKTVSGRRALVTGAAAGAKASSNDLDGGSTTIRSHAILLPADPADVGRLTFSWTFAHSANASADDALRVIVEAEDGTPTTVFEVLGSPVTAVATWRTATVDVDAWAGQAIHLVIEAVDGGRGNLVEAEIDDVRIRRP